MAWHDRYLSQADGDRQVDATRRAAQVSSTGALTVPVSLTFVPLLPRLRVLVRKETDAPYYRAASFVRGSQTTQFFEAIDSDFHIIVNCTTEGSTLLFDFDNVCLSSARVSSPRSLAISAPTNRSQIVDGSIRKLLGRRPSYALAT